MHQEFISLLQDTKNIIKQAEKTCPWEESPQEIFSSFSKQTLLLYKDDELEFAPFLSKVADALIARKCIAKAIPLESTWPKTTPQTVIAPFDLLAKHAPFKELLNPSDVGQIKHFGDWTCIALPTDIKLCQQIDQKKKLWNQLKQVLEL